jgi:hypothetical protein
MGNTTIYCDYLNMEGSRRMQTTCFLGNEMIVIVIISLFV